MFTAEALVLGAIGALLIGLSKTGVPGGALIAVPLFASIAEGRLIAGAVLPLLLVADLFAVAWYRQHARIDLLRALAVWIAVGFAGGVWFFLAVGSATRPVRLTIGVTVLAMVTIQGYRMIRRTPAQPATTASAAVFGAAGGFATFVSNAAGPVMNTYLAGLELPKHDMMGTSAWFYFGVNLAKIPLYLALGELATGGRFFTGESLAFDAVLVPLVVVGVFAGRALFHRIPQRTFLVLVLVFSAAGALRLVL